MQNMGVKKLNFGIRKIGAQKKKKNLGKQIASKNIPKRMKSKY